VLVALVQSVISAFDEDFAPLNEASSEKPATRQMMIFWKKVACFHFRKITRSPTLSFRASFKKRSYT